MALLETIVISLITKYGEELISRHGGNSHETYLQIGNETDEKLTIKVSEVDNYDWDGDSRPNHQFQGAVLEPHRCIKHRQEINAKSRTAMSTMTFSVDGTPVFKMRLDQWNAKAKTEKSEDFNLSNGYKANLTGGIGGNTQRIIIRKN